MQFFRVIIEKTGPKLLATVEDLLTENLDGFVLNRKCHKLNTLYNLFFKNKIAVLKQKGDEKYSSKPEKLS